MIVWRVAGVLRLGGQAKIAKLKTACGLLQMLLLSG